MVARKGKRGERERKKGLGSQYLFALMTYFLP
jgi:hypothetical protein